MCEGEVHGTTNGLSDSGWINSELFELWFLHHFLPFSPSARPILLLGHWWSHYNPSVIRKAAEERWSFFVYLPTLLIRHRHLTKGHLVHWKPVGKKYITSLLVKSQLEWLFEFHFQNYWKKLGLKQWQL